MALASNIKHSRFSIVVLRRFSQILFLAIFLILFVLTDYRGKDEIPFAVNIFFRFDPLVMASYVLSAKTFALLLLPAVLVLVATMLFGRFFCGWFCPLGTVLDLATKSIPKIAPVPRFIRGNVRYYLLLALLFAALLNVNLTGLLDPMAVFVRFLTFLFYPVVGETAAAGTELAGASSGGTVKVQRVLTSGPFFPPHRALQPEGLHRPHGVAGSGFRPLPNIPHCCLP